MMPPSFLQHPSLSTRRLRESLSLRVALWACAASAALAIAGCAVNPVTGERQLSLISEAQEIELGRGAAAEVQGSIGLVDDAALQAYVNRIGTALAAESERPNLPWSFGVVDDPTPNAFALPGGFIFVTRGLLNLMDSEAELASVLGHEIGHVTARHSVTQISRQQLAQFGLGLGGVLFPDLAPVGQALGAGLQLLFLKHGREAERQADELGFNYARAEGYDVGEMADVFAALQRVGNREDRSPLPSWLATHPAPAERIEAVKERIAGLGPQPPEARLGRAEFLGQIDGLVYGANPRNGFFRENVFFHPDLRFRMAVPPEWQTANLPQAVVAASPQGNAMVQLTLAGDVSPARATQQFLAQGGLRADRSVRETINGIPAVITRFQAQTQQGVVAGYVAYLEYRGRTYQLLTYSPSQVFGRAEQAFSQVIRSFAPLTDPAILAVQPQRIDVVRLDRDLSLARFQQTHPSSVPLDVLALLNQVTEPSNQLETGTLLKRVIGEDFTSAQR